MAGGRPAVFRSREGAEDDARAAARAVGARVRHGDVVVACRRAVSRRSCARRSPPPDAAVPAPSWSRATRDHSRRPADVIIAPASGPEVLAGSTRLKAGTATKLVLTR